MFYGGYGILPNISAGMTTATLGSSAIKFTSRDRAAAPHPPAGDLNEGRPKPSARHSPGDRALDFFVLRFGVL